MDSRTDTWLASLKFTCHLASCRFLPICRAGKKCGKFRPVIQTSFNRETSSIAIECKSYEREKGQTVDDALKIIRGEILDELGE